MPFVALLLILFILLLDVFGHEQVLLLLVAAVTEHPRVPTPISDEGEEAVPIRPLGVRTEHPVPPTPIAIGLVIVLVGIALDLLSAHLVVMIVYISRPLNVFSSRSKDAVVGGV